MRNMKHRLTYGVIMCNMNHMSTFEVIFGNMNHRNSITYYETICRQMKLYRALASHMSTYERIQHIIIYRLMKLHCTNTYVDK